MKLDRSRWHSCTNPWLDARREQRVACTIGRTEIWRFDDSHYRRNGFPCLPYTGYKGPPDFERPCS